MKRILIALIVFVPALASAQVSPYPLGVSPPIFGLPASAISSSGVVTSPQLLWPNGTVLLPGLAPASDPNTGWYWTSDGAILMSINGVLTHQWGNTYYANSSNSACLQFGAAGDATLCRGGAGIWEFGGGTGTPQMNNTLMGFKGRTFMRSTADGLLTIIDGSIAVGIQFNTGTAAPTVAACGTGTVTTGSRNTTGQITATGATTCTITFGAPAWTNAPFCIITPNAAPTTVPYINGDPTTTAFVVAGMTAGDNLKFSYHCVGRI